jgi:DNA helicase-2/ATP-dependent DNA helicase PcrA
MDLSTLNPPQREAVSHGGGPLLVLAGAGSGKTRVITHRIARLVAEGIPPDAIAAMTFTNKAAEEMRERVARLLTDRRDAKRLSMGTFHALGLHILRKEHEAIGLPKGFVIYDGADQLGCVREILRRVDSGRRLDVKAILTRISLAKNAFTSPADYAPHAGDEYDEITAEVYPKYQEAMRAFGAVDFDDLITETVRLLDTDAGARERWQGRFRFVMVDEYQDTNRAQLLLVKHLVAQHSNLVVVGDDDQSIYSWRGADPTNILRFAEMFPGAKIVKLEQNYRSTQRILAAANAVIANTVDRHGKTLWSERGEGDCIQHAVAPDVETEAKFVAREIARLKAEGAQWTDFAVLYRSNIQSRQLEEELRALSVPYAMYGGQQFFERKEVKDLIAYLRLALNGRDEIALRRVINYPARGIGATTLDRIAARAKAEHTSMWSVCERLADEDASAEDDIKAAARNAVGIFVDSVRRLHAGIDKGIGVVGATNALIEDLKLYDDLREATAGAEAAQRRISNVESLLRSLQKHEEKAPGRDELATYLRQLSLQTSDTDDAPGEKVVMTTLHGAKGLEFPIVFLVGMEEELLPHARTLTPQVTDVLDPDHTTDISEERRLCYVGITRAQRVLYLTRVCMRSSRGKPAFRTPSRFLLEIPEDLLDVRDLAAEAKEAVPVDEVKSFFSSFNFE